MPLPTLEGDEAELIKQLGERIHFLRVSHGMTVTELARRTDVSRETIRRAEAGTHSLVLIFVYRIAHALAVHIHDLLPPDSFLTHLGGAAAVTTTARGNQITRLIAATKGLRPNVIGRGGHSSAPVTPPTIPGDHSPRETRPAPAVAPLFRPPPESVPSAVPSAPAGWTPGGETEPPTVQTGSRESR